MLYDVMKQSIELAISKNPCSIQIHRKVVAPADGALSKMETTLPAQTVLIYPATRQGRRMADTEGTKEAYPWEGLAKDTADIQSGSDVTDSFTVEGLGTFEVTNVDPVQAEGKTAGYKLQLRKVE